MAVSATSASAFAVNRNVSVRRSMRLPIGVNEMMRENAQAPIAVRAASVYAPG